MTTAAEQKSGPEKVSDIMARGQVGVMHDLIAQSTAAREEYVRAANLYAGLVFVESKLEAERHGVKHEAIKRLMEGTPPPEGHSALLAKPGLSASAAEKIVETEPTYAAHLKLQRETVRDKNNAHTRMESAKMRVQIALTAVRTTGGF